MDEHFEANRQHWDAVVPIHAASDFYDPGRFKAGETSLKRVELEELGSVRGKTLLHLQCHFGLDTLSWARQGADVTGIDFSEPAIAMARALASEGGIDARFVVSNVYSLPEKLDEQFDIVFTSYGVLCWLPDIARWAEIAAQFVKPGGTFYVVEFHPFAGVFDNAPAVTGLRVRYPYFPSGQPLCFEADGTYAGTAKLARHVIYQWPHPISEVLTALIQVGLRIEFLHEFPFSTQQFLPFTRKVDRETVRLTEHDGSVPLLYSSKATKATRMGSR